MFAANRSGRSGDVTALAQALVASGNATLIAQVLGSNSVAGGAGGTGGAGAISTTLVHLANISYRLGRTLHFDAATYSVTGDAEANKMFTRAYRKPFVVPEKV